MRTAVPSTRFSIAGSRSSVPSTPPTHGPPTRKTARCTASPEILNEHCSSATSTAPNFSGLVTGRSTTTQIIWVTIAPVTFSSAAVRWRGATTTIWMPIIAAPKSSAPRKAEVELTQADHLMRRSTKNSTTARISPMRSRQGHRRRRRSWPRAAIIAAGFVAVVLVAGGVFAGFRLLRAPHSAPSPAAAKPTGSPNPAMAPLAVPVPPGCPDPTALMASMSTRDKLAQLLMVGVKAQPTPMPSLPTNMSGESSSLVGPT